MRMFIDIARSRHSCRMFTNEPLSAEERALILEAGSLAPSGKGRRPVRLVPVEDPAVIRELAKSKDSGTKALDTATFAVIVAADSASSDTWVEDSANAAVMMQLQAEELGLGSCWVQNRLRTAKGEPSETVTKAAAGLDPSLSVLCIVAFGRKA